MKCALRLLLSAFLGAIFQPAIAEEPCRYVKLQTIEVAVKKNRPIVEGTLNKVPISMLLDTGAQFTTLTRDAVLAARLTEKETDRATMIGLGGESAITLGHVDSFSIGPIRGGEQDLPVVQERHADDTFGVAAGANFLFQADLELNLAKSEVSFFQSVECPRDAFLAYWDPSAPYLRFDRSKFDARPMFTVRVNGLDVRAMIDSGAPMSVIDRSVAAAAGVTTNTPGVITIGSGGGFGKNLVSQWIAPFNTITIGGEVINRVRIIMVDFKEGLGANPSYDVRTTFQTQPKMILGMDFLRTHRVLFALGQKRMYFSYLGGDVFAVDAEIAKAAAASAASLSAQPVTLPAGSGPSPEAP